ncbi:hypothetical protein D3C73_1378820 [compost metagenome]
MWLGEQYSLVRLEAAAPEISASFPDCSTTLLAASTTEDATMPVTMSTLRSSTHWRTVLAPTSGLFRSSALNTTIFLPLTWPPKSSMAMFNASRPPGPDRSR